MFYRSIIVALILISSASFCMSTQKKVDDASCHSNECYIFLAPSSIKGAGMGVYVTRSFKKGEVLLSSDHGSTIPIIDPYRHPNHWKWTSLFNNYAWAQPTGASDELKYEAEYVIDLQVGLGIFPNSHSFLHNLAFEIPDVATYDDTFGKEENVGSGAYSYHKGRIFTASRDIEEGEELFLNYGDRFLDSRESLSNVPREVDFLLASNLIKNVKADLDVTLNFFASIDNASKDVNMLQDLKELTIARILSVVCKSLQIEPSSKERVKSLLPKTLDEIQALLTLSDDISRRFDDVKRPLTFALAKTNIESRDKAWIKQNGKCMDNIFVAKSSLPFAGNGAISKRFIPHGSIVATIPLLQIADQKLISTYRTFMRDGNTVHDLNDEVGTQLLLNYCFGHKNSTILLCPTTNAIFVNHCSKNIDSDCSPNAVFKWSRNNETQKWMGKSLDDLTETIGWGLSFDLVSTRDIKLGEEIFVDYGQGWEDAWDKHLKEWEQNQNKARKVIDDQSFSKYATEFKQLSNDMFTACLFQKEDGQQWEKDSIDTMQIDDMSNLEDQEILSLYARDGSYYTDEAGIKSYWPCNIISSDLNNDQMNEKNTNFLVRLFEPFWEVRRKEKHRPIFLTNYPSTSIKFITKPYRSHLHLTNAFRHYIEIPDKDFPEQWKNKHQDNNNRSGREFEAGERVEIENSGEWHIGKIVKKRKRGLYDVNFEDGHSEKGVSDADIRRITNILYTTSPHPFP